MTEYLEYQTKPGDRWDLIAWANYGDPYAYEELIRANPTVAAEPILSGGINLRVPILEATTLNSEWAPWRT
jgi:phage tail protein X